MQGIEYVPKLVGKVALLESPAINGPQQRLRGKPHLVTDEMSKGTKGKDKKPGFPMAPIEVKPCEGNEQEKGKRMAKYSAITQALSEEERPHRLIYDIREKRADEQEPCVYLF